MDTDLPHTLLDCLAFIIDVSGVVIIVAIANYWLLIPAAIIGVILGMIRYLYVNTSRSVKRLESICKYELCNCGSVQQSGFIRIGK